MFFSSFLRTLQKKRSTACGVRFSLAFILSGSQIFGGYAPFALGFMAASGAGMEGLSALLGLLLGTLLFMSFTDAMKYISAAVLIYSVSMAFYDTRFYDNQGFLPLSAAACTAAVGFVYLSQSGLFSSSGAYFLLEVGLSAACAAAYSILLRPLSDPPSFQEKASLFLLAVTVLIAVAAIPFAVHFSFGRVLSVLLVLYIGRKSGPARGCAAGFCTGLAMDTASNTIFFSLSYALSALFAGAFHCSRAVYTLLFICGTLISFFWASDAPIIYALMESSMAGIAFLFLPEKLFRKARAPKSGDAPPKLLEQRLRSAAAVFRSLYEHLSHGTCSPVNDENIATVFDHAADQICRSCPLCATCWEADYVTTYNALNDTTSALIQRGRLLAADFPRHFSERCIRLNEFIRAVDAEFSALLMRRQYLRQLDSTRTQAKEQYARLSDLLSDSADFLKTAPKESTAVFSPAARWEISSKERPKAGQTVSGDAFSTFQTPNGKLFLLLSDGMGCGEAAHRESSMAVRLLQQFLQAGIEAPTALRTLNAALTLRCDESGAFTTLDLMVMDLKSGDAAFYKYGAAPSYICHGSHLRRITGSVLPAGLSSGSQNPEATFVHLVPGDLVLMGSDGFADGADDPWLTDFLSDWKGTSLDALAAHLMDTSTLCSGASDDATLLALRLSPLPEKEPVAL